ncbi:MAG: hypothetical protein QXL16_00535 [Candidatus Micrarchaeaceae archaeon]
MIIESMQEEPNFMDLVVIRQITPGMQAENLSRIINASIFDAYNLSGSLKQKGLIDFEWNAPGQSVIKVTESGKALIDEAEKKADAPLDALDDEILFQLSGGRRNPNELGESINLSQRDLAIRLFKLGKQGFLIFDIKNGKISLMLTEKGFMKVVESKGKEEKKEEKKEEERKEEQRENEEILINASKKKDKAPIGLYVILIAIIIVLVAMFLKRVV